MSRIITLLGSLLRGLLRFFRSSDASDVNDPPTVETPLPPLEETGPDREAASLSDLLRVRAANRAKIEAVNGNLGTALGFKWSGGRRTDHPCVIIFVPQKAAPEEVPDAEKAPTRLEGPDGLWCRTDVVSGARPARLRSSTPSPT